MADIARIIEVVEPEAKALGFDLVRVRLFGKTEVGDEEHTLQIMAERPETGQLVIADCAALSHRISDRIDALEEAGEVLIEDAYRLEVSSPGIDRPLTRLKDFANWTGHEARIELDDLLEGRKRFRGELLGLEGETISIADDGVTYAVPFGLIANAKLVLTDKLIAASRPIDASGVDVEEFDGADDILEEQED
ncbi:MULTISPECIES: ribosome maturation protein RimP [unclassified Novosphingobium]|jgi:ribosome maturation factor RimP|uniref:ribosome maturation protein RimP n=1 Tax=unclassified Novosphingobium TaxID=2644732 RepID=UPI000F5D51FA|nr:MULTISPECIES: ribosome maturation protein RimP [unclassified Novosphingobium]MBF5089303.1 ribosome maturation protein RimP [Novosphingobium sp. NBM11]RQW41793.1 ribosome maturation protein RimP [Novosphingobium sp. LASN5T]